MAETPAGPAVLVIGAGAAGLMAALQASRSGAAVTVVERTADGGRKILISGGGRCNVLPAVLDESRFVTDSSRHSLRRLLGSWPLADQRRFFEETLGAPLVLEPETGKLFPASNRAREVRDRLVAAARDAGARFRFGQAVTGLAPAAGGWTVRLGDGTSLAAPRVIVATGGLSVPSTGSDGTGLRLLEELGHALVPPYPALTPLVADPPVHAGLAGVSLPVAIRARWGREAAASCGGFLFTHRGYSGPAVLDVSHLAVRSRIGAGGTPKARGRAGDGLGEAAVISVAWGGIGVAGWEERLQPRGRESLAGVLRRDLPNRLADRLLEEAGVASDRQLAQFGRDERRALIGLLAEYRLPWTGDEGYRKAEVTGGGVRLGEVDPVTLESRRAPGLYLAGEVLDAFGPIGGFNFAWAWATGRAAGLGAAARSSAG
ncbi:MAG: NAD(P)/FAD-dependent oxidoreductase [Gemmatimonadales bacterium]